MFGDFALWVTPIIGVGLSIYSARLCYKFIRSSRPIGHAVKWMVFGEFVGLLVFTAFAFMEVLGKLPGLDPLLATYLRWVSFLFTGGSTLHMNYMIRRITEHYELVPKK